MTAIAFIDLISAAGDLAAIIFILAGWKKAFHRGTKLLLLGLLFIDIVYSLLLAIQWSGLTGYPTERLEDLTGALTPITWAFLFYAMTQEIAKKDITESRERYQTLVENVEFGISLVDSDYNIVMTNSAAGRLFGCDASELIGQKCYDKFENRNEAYSYCPCVKSRVSGKPEEIETEAIRSDGSKMSIRVHTFPLFDEGGRPSHFIEVTENITERKKTERAMQTIVEASSAKIGPEFFKSLVKAIAIALETKYVIIGKLAENKPETIETVAVWAGHDFAESFEYNLAGTPCKEIVYGKKFFYSNNARIEFPKDDDLIKLGVESYFGVPLLDTSGQSLGYLSALHDKPIHEGVSRIESILTVFAGRVSSELERLKNEQELINIAKFPSEDPNPVLRMSGDGMILYHNKAADGIIDPAKCREAELSLKILRQSVSKALASGKALQRELTGCGIVYALTFAPFKESDYVNIYGLDITDRKQAAEALQKSEERYRGLVESSSDWIWEVNAEGVYTYSSPQVESILGYRPEEVIGKTPLDLMPPAEKIRIENIFKELVSTGNSISMLENLNLHKDGREVIIETSGLPMFDGARKVIGYRGIDRDITQRKKNEQKIRDSEEKYRKLIETAADAVFVADTETGIIIDTNKSAEELLGMGRNEIIGLHQTQLHPKKEREQYRKFFQSHVEKKKSLMTEEAFVCHKDGHVIPVEINFSVTEVGGKKIIQGIFRDITERKENERRLLESEEYLRSIFRVAPAGIGVLANRVFMQVNKKLCEMTGYDEEELIGQNARMLYPSDMEYEFVGNEKYAQIRNHGTGTVETQWKRKDDHLIDILLSSTPMDMSDLSKGVTFTALDITERKRVEVERRRLNRELEAKNEELEAILYAASHDLKSPLVNLQGFSYELSQSCELIRSIVGGKEKAKDMENKLDTILNKEIPTAVDFIATNTTKMDSLLTGLLDIGRLSTELLNPQPINMNEMISHLISGMSYEINQVCAEVIAEPLPTCRGDLEDISRVFLNLLTNAVKFLDPNRPGKIRITGKAEGQKSIYCVEDNGIGIAAEYHKKIFEIFYRLDPEKKGDGVGLTIVKRIVEKHSGKVWVESEPGKGSKFFVCLPNG